MLTFCIPVPNRYEEGPTREIKASIEALELSFQEAPPYGNFILREKNENTQCHAAASHQFILISRTQKVEVLEKLNSFSHAKIEFVFRKKKLVYRRIHRARGK